MADSISEKIKRFYSLINDYKEGAPDTRYKSWEWCRKAFTDNKDLRPKGCARSLEEATVDKMKEVDLLALHLAFYLASWGMYRGSSFLLQRDYKTHKKAVWDIFDRQYDTLWDFDPKSAEDIKNADRLLFDKEIGIYWKIKGDYSGYGNSGLSDEPSETLVTKILMGTLGCIPAFDRFLKDGIEDYISKCGNTIEYEGRQYTLSSSAESGAKKKNASEAFKALAAFAAKNKKELTIDVPAIPYPPMKCVDMYFWEIGYELNLAKALLDNPASAKAARLLEQAEKLGFNGSNSKDVADKIIESNK